MGLLGLLGLLGLVGLVGMVRLVRVVGVVGVVGVVRFARAGCPRLRRGGRGWRLAQNLLSLFFDWFWQRRAIEAATLPAASIATGHRA